MARKKMYLNNESKSGTAPEDQLVHHVGDFPDGFPVEPVTNIGSYSNVIISTEPLPKEWTLGGVQSRSTEPLDINMLSFTQKVKIANELIMLFDENGPIAKLIKSSPNGHWIYQTVSKAVEHETKLLMGDADNTSLEVNEAVARIKELVSVVENNHVKILAGLKTVLSQTTGVQAPQPQQPRYQPNPQAPVIKTKISQEAVFDEETDPNYNPSGIIGL